MAAYKNTNGTSNILAYQIGDDFITVEFKSSPPNMYTYTHASAGVDNIEQMKALALRGNGLNSFVNTNVKKNYESKW